MLNSRWVYFCPQTKVGLFINKANVHSFSFFYYPLILPSCPSLISSPRIRIFSSIIDRKQKYNMMWQKKMWEMCGVCGPLSCFFILHPPLPPPFLLSSLLPLCSLPLVSLLLPFNYLLSFPSLFPFPLHSSPCFPFNFFHLFIPQTKYILCSAELGGVLCWNSPYQDALVAGNEN